MGRGHHSGSRGSTAGVTEQPCQGAQPGLPHRLGKARGSRASQQAPRRLSTLLCVSDASTNGK